MRPGVARLGVGMSELQEIMTALEGAARRQRWSRALRGLWRGLFWGALVSLLLAGAYHLFPLPLWTLFAAATAPVAFLIVGLIVGGWRKPQLPMVARWVDERHKLQQRLGSALEVANLPPEKLAEWRELLIGDAARHARDLDARKLLPFHLPKTAHWAVLLLALVAGLGFVPEYRSKNYLQKKADEENIKNTGKQLADLTRRNLEKRTPALEPTQKALEGVAQLGDQLTKKSLTRDEALKDLANVAEKLRDELRDVGSDPAIKKLQQAARNPTGADSQTAAGLQKQMESLQKQLGTPTGNPEALENFKKSLEKMKEAAKGMADKNSPGNDAERQKLAESLSALSRQAQQMGLQMPNLDDAMEALAANQTDLFLKEMDAALEDLEKLKEMAKNIQQLQQQAEKLGKDLAEQLENGQPELAQSTMQKMIDQLNAANLSPEQMDKMVDEVSKAVDPAGNYGKVAEYLKQAANQMKSGQKGDAAQSLAAASKELDKLMQQLGDAKELAETLQNLEEASQCIGSGQGWRPGKPRFGKGGKPGSGVGTWAEDENAEWDGQSTAGWDNSGVERPDMAGKGETDRGEGELTDALKPTKVKGQFSPGGQMPSVTLKGVSIKGQSQVNFEESATAAQSDAQSALSQEKVPRAYQGTVKDYFDDLKK